MLDVSFRKSFGGFLLQTQFQAGNEVLGVLGPSGSGKSMTLRAIAGIETPDEGRIAVNGQVLFDSAQSIDVPPRLRNIGYVFQHYALFPHLTVKENIGFGLAGLSGGEKNQRLQETLETFHLKDRENHYPDQLSGGQQQRVSLARTLITRPAILLLDEPFSALDAHIKRHLENELLETIRNNFSGTVLLVTHNIEEAHRLCDRILVYAQGRNVQIGDKHEVVEQPATLAVAQVVGCRNLLEVDASVESGVVVVRCGNLTLQGKREFPAATKMFAGFHSYHLQLHGDNPGQPNTFHGLIVDVLEGTFFNTITLNCQGIVLYCDMEHASWTRLARQGGDRIYAHIPPEKVFWVG